MRGMLYAFSGATLWGLSGVCSDFLLSNYGMSPLLLTMVRMVAAAALFCLALGLRYKAQVRAMLHDRQTMRRLLIFGTAGLYACQATYIISIGFTNAGTATVMQSLNIVFCPLVGWLAGKSKLAWKEKVSVALAFCAVLVIATQGDITTLSMPLLGLVWGLANGITETFYTMYPGKLFKRWGSFACTGLGMVFGSALATLVWAVSVAMDGTWSAGTVLPHLDLAGWMALAAVCIVGTFVAFSLFLHGIHLIGPVRGNLLGAMEPASAAALSALWLGTPFTGWDWLGLCLMIATIFLVSMKGAAPAPETQSEHA